METLAGRTTDRRTAVRGVQSGNGVVLVGEAGIGKTALAAAVADDVAAAQGAPVVRLLATAASRAVPYSALAPLLPTDPDAFHPALVPGLLLRRLAGREAAARPLIVVDDAHWLDDHSSAALLTVIHQGAARALVTVRTGTAPSDAVTALWKDGLLERLDIGPLDVAATADLLRAHVGGEVAAISVQRLWEISRGNPLYLTELARAGVAGGRFALVDGIWWWSGQTQVPPRLAELLEYRLDDLSADALQARDVLALGEPLPYDTLAAVSSVGALLELDGKGLLASDATGNDVRVRFAHPLLAAVAAARLSPARRRHLAGLLNAAPGDGVDLLRRAIWQEAAGGTPDVALLVSAARSLIVVDPATAVRLARRAAQYDNGPSAAVTLADAHAELAEPAEAAAALVMANERIRTPADRLEVDLSWAGLRLWSLRRPQEALDGLRSGLGYASAELAAEYRSAGALLLLFAGRPAAAAEQARAVLATGPEPDARRRCLLVRVAAAMLADQPSQAAADAAALADVLATYPQPPSVRSLATAVTAVAELLATRPVHLPQAGAGAGRWPDPRPAGDAAAAAPTWPLLDGLRRHLTGDLQGAAVALREATVQQRAGEGLFRSEATGALAVVLAEQGRTDQAREVLATQGPDAVGMVPGVRAWAEAWVLAAAGQPTSASRALVRTARDAAEAGAVNCAVWYLADAARLGAAEQAAAEARHLARRVSSPVPAARLLGIRARATGRPQALLEAARAHLAAGLSGHAAELADLAERRFGRGEGGAARAAAASLAEQARAGLAAHVPLAPGVEAAVDDLTVRVPEQLTAREAEVARLAAGGLRDKDIAAELVLSVRTVESHLATTYRKLNITSRRELVTLLAGSAP